MVPTMTDPSPRRRDGEQRRRDLCDAGIRVLAEHGSRGLTHAQVDRYAGVPTGTTSYYYRTREALLRGVGLRVGEIDSANLLSVSAEPLDTEHPFARLAQLTMEQAQGEGLALNRARHELLLCTTRDPALAEGLQRAFRRIFSMARDVVAQLQPDVTDDTLISAQSAAVMTFISGVFLRLAIGDGTPYTVDSLSTTLEGIVTAVAAQHTA